MLTDAEIAWYKKQRNDALKLAANIKWGEYPPDARGWDIFKWVKIVDTLTHSAYASGPVFEAERRKEPRYRVEGLKCEIEIPREME